MAELLLDPNVAYLFLVAGFMLAVFAVITPGTGFFEVGTLFAFAIAGWQVYSIPINGWALVVLVVGVIPFLIAVRFSKQLWLLVISIAALVVGSAFLFQGEGLRPAVNPWLALLVSVLSGGLIWIMMTKTLAAHATLPSHDLTQLIGEVGVAKTEIHREGTVYVGMEDWTARSDTPIQAGAWVRVLAREGLVLHVELAGEEE